MIAYFRNTLLIFLVFSLFMPSHRALTQETWTFYVSIGAFRVKRNATQLRKKVLTDWEGPEIRIRKEGRLHVVLVGPFRSDIEAEIYQVKLETMGYVAVILRR